MKSPAIFHFRQSGSPRGGITVVYNFETKAFGCAICSARDMYSKKLGVTIAIGRSKSPNYKIPFSTISREHIRNKAIDIARHNQGYVNEIARLRADAAKLGIDQMLQEASLCIDFSHTTQ